MSKVIIAGGRTITNNSVVIDAVRQAAFPITEVICGMAAGVDSTGAWVAKSILGVPVIECPADWDHYGPAAGPIRNQRMANLADALILVWDGKSKGSADMKAKAMVRMIPIYQHILNENGSQEGFLTSFNHSGPGIATCSIKKVYENRLLQK